MQIRDLSLQGSRNGSLVFKADSREKLTAVCVPLNKKLHCFIYCLRPAKGQGFPTWVNTASGLLKKGFSLAKHLISLKINYSQCRFRYRLRGEIMELVFQARSCCEDMVCAFQESSSTASALTSTQEIILLPSS